MEGLCNAFTELDGPGLFSKVHEELCDLVGIHAGSRDLDGTCPVEVVVTEVKGELLNDRLLNWRVIEGHVEVSREDASLSCGLWDQIEVILSLRVLILNYLGVNESPAGWVVKPALAVLNEEPLCDPLVHNDDSDVGLLLGEVVGLIDGLSKLLDFCLKNLPAHGITNTVSVDNEMLRVVSMSLYEAAKSSLHGLLELLGDDLLTLALQDPLRVVLTSLLVDTGAEPDNGLRT